MGKRTEKNSVSALRGMVCAGEMKIYMAGGVSGNLKPYWKQLSSYLSFGCKYTEACDEAMKVFLAGGEGRHRIIYEDILSGGKRQKADNTGYNICDCSWQGSPRGGAGGGTTSISANITRIYLNRSTIVTQIRKDSFRIMAIFCLIRELLHSCKVPAQQTLTIM